MSGCAFSNSFSVRFTKRDAVTLPSGFLSDFGIDKNAKARALRSLELAKLISVKRMPGKTAIVKLVARTHRG